MGDSRIRILIASNLLPPSSSANDNNGTNTKKWQETLNKLFSSDTTIREVCNDLDVVMSLLKRGDVSLWDCTVHPPQDITDWPLQTYKDLQGLQSKTLFDAGWFPSGTLRLSLKSEGAPTATSSSLQNDEAQYNQRSDVATGSNAEGALQLVGNNVPAASLLPSQVLESVTHRFDRDNQTESEQMESAQNALQERRQNKQARAAREQERFQKLEAHIQRLGKQSQTKNKPVSDQVRRMLIKSRATGSKSLKQQDRVYFHIVLSSGDDADNDTTIGSSKEAFCYFSRQDTVGGGILFKFQHKSSTTGPRQPELLVRRATDDETIVYRRLPTVMRVYEAIQNQYLEPEVNNVVIRWYDPALEEPTTSVLDDKESSVANETNDDVVMSEVVDNQPISDPQPDGTPTAVALETSDDSIIEDADLVAILKQHDEDEQKRSKKKSSKSSTSVKVRQMLMKSKAKGDAKRLKMEERFFFEIVTLVMDSSNGSSSCETSLVYLGKKDPLDRILRDCVKPSLSANKNTTDGDFELLVPGTSNKFQRLSNLTMTFQEAESAKLFEPFERLVLRFHST